MARIVLGGLVKRAKSPDTLAHIRTCDLQGRSITKRLSKKDANAFLKAVKRYGRVERMADIAEEVGSSLQEQSASARCKTCSPSLARSKQTSFPGHETVAAARTWPEWSS